MFIILVLLHSFYCPTDKIVCTVGIPQPILLPIVVYYYASHELIVMIRKRLKIKLVKDGVAHAQLHDLTVAT